MGISRIIGKVFEKEAGAVIRRSSSMAKEGEKAILKFSPESLARGKELGLSQHKMAELRELGNYTKERTVSAETLKDNLWRNRNEKGSIELYSQAFQDADGSLVKYLSNGNKVVISKDGTKTIRKVYNQKGELIVDNTKQFSTSTIGNKTIREKTSQTTWNTVIYPKGMSQTYKFDYKAERVYDKNGKFLGMRQTEKQPVYIEHGIQDGEKWAREYRYSENVYVTKSVPKEYGVKAYTKEFSGENGRAVRKTFAGALHNEKGAGAYKPVFNSGNVLPHTRWQPSVAYDNRTSYWGTVGGTKYNSKGLPMPTYYSGGINSLNAPSMDKMNLKEMRELAEKMQPRKHVPYNERSVIYSSCADGLEHLDIPYSVAKKV